MGTATLPWARPFHRRCRARVGDGQDWGRCELSPHGPEIDHALERGIGGVLRFGVWSARVDPPVGEG